MLKDIPLRYKFWLVNGFSFVGMCLLVLFALLIFRQSLIAERYQSAANLLQTQASWLEVESDEIPATLKGAGLTGQFAGVDLPGSRELKRQLPLQSLPNSRVTRVDVRTEGTLVDTLFGMESNNYVAVWRQDSHWLAKPLYIPSLLELVIANFWYFGGAVFVLMSLVLVASQVLIVFVQRHITALNDIMREVATRNVLDVHADIDCRDEIGQMSVSFNAMVDKLATVVGQVSHSADTIQAQCSTLAGAAGQSSELVESQFMVAEQVATAMNELTATISEISRVASDTLQRSEVANKVSHDGASTVLQMQQSISRLANDIGDSANVIEELANESQTIGGALDVIRAIAEQTNLLALNAAIEAARAGEQGRGFAVVADEVRSLAQRVQESTGQIKGIVDTLQSSAAQAVALMQRRSAEARECVEQARSAGDILNEVKQSAEQTASSNRQVANSIRQHDDALEHINQNVVTMRDQLEELVSEISAISDTGRNTLDCANRMHTTVHQFKLQQS